ncbi:iron-containing redox enzyme family protein [Paraburkholderia xenovorans]|uniref:iron-containing redox enzyme family protein n=1 Tax=Paraburkholderia xenovorans TaxID=36873 RepID=UPI0038BDD2B9
MFVETLAPRRAAFPNFAQLPHSLLDDAARPEHDVDAQRVLQAFYLREMASPAQFAAAPRLADYAHIHALEAAWNEAEEQRIDMDAIPENVEDFSRWYWALHRQHRKAVAPFFDYVADTASLEELAFYMMQEEQVDGRFDDVIALAQIGMSGDMKLALAENYWDEMGRGKLDDLHTTLFARSVDYMRGYMRERDLAPHAPTAALKNGNLLMMYALRRHYLPRLLGALAIMEHTAPARFARLVRGLRRFDVPEHVIHYHELHIEVDAQHGKELLNRVLLPLLAAHPEMLREVCIGCLIRFNVAIDYYDCVEQGMTQVAARRIDIARH